MGNSFDGEGKCFTSILSDASFSANGYTCSARHGDALGVAQVAERDISRCQTTLEIDAAAVFLPVAVAGRLQAFAAADLLWQSRRLLFGMILLLDFSLVFN